MKKNLYETTKQVDALIGETYVYAIIVVLIALALAYFIAKSIHFQGGKNERSHIRRRIWCIIIGLVATISFFLYNVSVVSPKILKAPLAAKFSSANIIATISILLIYTALALSTMMIFRKSKWGSILGKSK